MTEPNEPGSGRKPEDHSGDGSGPDQSKPLESGVQSRIKHDPAALNAGPLFPDKTRVWKLSSQGKTRPTTGVRFEVDHAVQAEKEGLPESGPGFPVSSPRPSLRMQGPVPAFPSPGGHRQRKADAAKAPGREDPPVVRVSIGRVEVRAIMPSAPAGKADPPKPRISLDEYLRQQIDLKVAYK